MCQLCFYNVTNTKRKTYTLFKLTYCSKYYGIEMVQVRLSCSTQQIKYGNILVVQQIDMKTTTIMISIPLVQQL